MNDPVNHPDHYTDGGYEVIDFIEDHRLGFHYGNAVKYISRAGKKDPEKKKEDLEKAIWYLRRSPLHSNSNFVKCLTMPSNQWRSHISIDDYCENKGLSENLTNAIAKIIDFNDPVSAVSYIREEIKEGES